MLVPLTFALCMMLQDPEAKEMPTPAAEVPPPAGAVTPPVEVPPSAEAPSSGEALGASQAAAPAHRVADVTAALRSAIGDAFEATGLRFEDFPAGSARLLAPECVEASQSLKLVPAPYQACLDFVRKVLEAPLKPQVTLVRLSLAPATRETGEEKDPLKHRWLMAVGFRAGQGDCPQGSASYLDLFEAEQNIRKVLEASGVAADLWSLDLRLEVRPPSPGAPLPEASSAEVTVPQTGDALRIERAFRRDDSLFDATVTAKKKGMKYSVNLKLTPRASLLERLAGALQPVPHREAAAVRPSTAPVSAPAQTSAQAVRPDLHPGPVKVRPRISRPVPVAIAAPGRAEETVAQPAPRIAVFRHKDGKFVPVETPETLAARQDLEPGAIATVVHDLRYVSPQNVTVTVEQALSRQGPGDYFQIQGVPGAAKVILTGDARLVDAALRILEAIDVPEADVPLPEEPRATLRVFRLQSAEPAEVVATIQAVLGTSEVPGRPPMRAMRPGAASGGDATRIVPDTRSHSIIVRTTRPEDLETIEAILKEIDVSAQVPEPPLRQEQ